MGAAKSVDDSVDTTGWLLRTEAADLLDVSHTTVKNWDGTFLHPRKVLRDLPNGGSRPVWVYDPKELARIPAARRQRAKMMPGDRGEIAARAFEMFDEGASSRVVVMRLREPPETVEILREQWERLGGSELVIHPDLHAELVRLVGAFDSVAGLIARLREVLVGADRVGADIVANASDASASAKLPGDQE